MSLQLFREHRGVKLSEIKISHYNCTSPGQKDADSDQLADYGDEFTNMQENHHCYNPGTGGDIDS